MARYTQANRPLAITTPLGEDAFLLVGLRGQEGLSQLFRFQLDVLAEGAPPAFDRILGQSVSVRLQAPGSSMRYLSGIISEMTQLGHVYGGAKRTPFIRYRLEMVPKLWLLTRRFQSRIFQHLSIPEILAKILHDEWSLNVVFRFQQQYAPRVRCVQYRETDFAFVNRLMEDEGIHYWFAHSKAGYQLIISDNSRGAPALQDPSTLLYDEMQGGGRPEARISRWEKTQRLRSYKYTLWDHCFELPSVHLEASEHAHGGPVSVGQAKHRIGLRYQLNKQELLEIYDYPGGYAQRFDGVDRQGSPQPEELRKIFDDNQRTAKIRMQQETTESLSIIAESDIGHLAPGYQFTLSRHFDGDGPYLLTQVEHVAEIEGNYFNQGSPFRYGNTFRCLPVAVQYRPPSVTPRPTVQGTQTATVVGPASVEIHCDKYGRVKVQFPWDRTDIDQAQGKHVLHDSSGWVRVSQTWAGKGYGAIHIPRVGQEVIVDFLEGDPDKPIIVGAVYNAEQMPPYTLPLHHTHSGLKSHTRGGGSNEFSHLTFEDYPDGEHVHLHSEQDMTHSAEQHLVQNVGKEHHLHVGTASYRQIGGLPGLDHGLWVGKVTPTAAGSADPAGGDAGGSGSGTSSDSSSTPAAPTTATPFYSISPSQLTGTAAKDMDVTLGWRTGNTLGLYTTLKFGVNQSTTLNPFAFNDFFPGTGGLLSWLGQALFLGPLMRNAMGAVNVVIGANTSIVYGRNVSVQRGPNLQVRANPKKSLTIPAGLAYNLAVLNEVFLPVENDALSPGGAAAVAAVTAALDVIALNFWVVGEFEEGMKSWLSACGNWTAVAPAVVPVVPLVQEVVIDRTEESIEEQAVVVEQEANVVPPPLGPAEYSADATLVCDAPYSLCAPLITLLSAPTALETEDPVGIIIQATGVEGTDGEVVIYGTGKGTLLGGAQAYVQCVTEEEVTGKVTIDCGPVGTISLQTGLAQEPNCVQLTPEGITLTSLEEIKASVEENSLSLNPAMISLSSGPSSIAITPEGITISCGPSSIEISLEGVTISGPMISITGDALVEIT